MDYKCPIESVRWKASVTGKANDEIAIFQRGLIIVLFVVEFILQNADANFCYFKTFASDSSLFIF
jgi:hypothetical protein